VILFNPMVERKHKESAPDSRLDCVYGAIADPTRRAILATLARGEARVGDLAARFPISFNGVSKHVQVLERAGLIARHVHGREHHLRLQPEPLGAAAAWLNRYRAFWESRLDSLEHLLREEQRSFTPRPQPRGRRRRH
jgi:DNA-binding transcriptional ArsR family regulator